MLLKSDYNIIASRRYLNDESLNKRGVAFDSWQLVICKDIPIQKNGCDCGVFMCMVSKCMYMFKCSNNNYSMQDTLQMGCHSTLVK